MKVLFYKDNFSTGRGADLAVGRLIDLLRTLGYEISLVVGQAPSVPLSYPFDNAVKCIYLPKPKRTWLEKIGLTRKLARFYADLRSTILALDPDVVISTGTNELLDLVAGGELPMPIIQQLHIAPEAICKRRQKKRAQQLREAFKKPAIIQVLLENQIETFKRLFPACSQAIIAIGNTTSYLEKAAEVAHTYQPIILYPAALNPAKNQTLLIEAFALLAKDFPTWQVHLYGVGKQQEEQRLRALIQQHGLTAQVLLKGYVKDLTEAYATCAFVAFPSLTEGYGMIIIDAAAFAKATLGLHQTTAVAALIEDGKTGLLAHALISDFADKLRLLMRSEASCRTLGEASHQWLETHATPDLILKQWQACIEQVVVQSDKA